MGHASRVAPAEVAVKWRGGLDPVVGAIAYAAEAVVVVAVMVDLVVTFINTVGRYLYGEGLDWSGDLSTILLSLIAFVGAPAYFHRGSGMAYTALVDHTKGLLQSSLVATGQWLTLGICAAILFALPDFLTGQALQQMPTIAISQAVTTAPMLVGFALFAVFTVDKLRRLPWRALLGGLLLVGCIALLIVCLRSWSDDGTLTVDPLAALLVVLAIAFLTAVPIALVLALGGVAFFLVTDSAPLVAAPAALQAGVASFLLVAVPFFLLTGVLMEVTGMARRLIDAVQEWVGHWRGGLLLASVVSMYVFSGMSGSKAADVATVGSVMKAPLRLRGYPATESVAVLAAAAAMGEVIPPSIALLILGSITTLSIGTLFIAGIVPAGVLAITLMAGILLRAYRYGLPKGPPFRLGRALRTLPPALPALLVPVIVLGGIVLGIASPTESSSFAVIYGLAAAVFIYRSVTLRSLWTAAREASVVAGMVLLMMATANLLSQAILMDQLGTKLGVALAAITSPTLFLFVSLAIVIVLGFVLEGFPAILIAAPLLLPIATRHGVDPLHYGILLTMAVGIGVFMPPFGIGYYIACAVGDAAPHQAIKASLFYNAFLVIGLVAAILFPSLIVGLPRWLGM